jgi:hypothetical protein
MTIFVISGDFDSVDDMVDAFSDERRVMIVEVDRPVYLLDPTTDYIREYFGPTRCEISGFFDEVGEEQHGN